MNISAKGWVKAYIIDILPIVSLFVYIFGFTYFISYYMVFDINIIPFITLSEILISTISVLFISMFLMVSAFAWNSFIDRQTKKIVTSILSPINSYIFRPLVCLILKSNFIRHKITKIMIGMDNNAKSHTLRSLIGIQYASFLLRYILFLYIALYIIEWVYLRTVDMGIVYMTIALFLSAAISPIITIRVNKDIPSKIHNIIKTRIRFYAASMILIATYSVGILIAKQTIENPKKQCNVIYTNDNIYKTDSTVVQIGETNLSIFLYNKVNDEIIIINRENVSKIEKKIRYKERKEKNGNI